MCEGQKVSRTAYAELFSVIGTIFGAGDGSTTFGIPKIGSRYICAGWNSTNYPNDTGSVLEAGLPNITGKLGYLLSTGTTSNFSTSAGVLHWEKHSNSTKMARTTDKADVWFDAVLDLSKGNSIYGNANTVRPPTILLCPCIVAKSNSYVTYCFRRTA